MSARLADEAARDFGVRRTRERLLQAVALIGLAAILYWGLRRVNRAELAHALAQTDATLLVLAAVVNFAALAVQAWRWHALLQPIEAVGYGTSLAGMILSFAASSVLPARAGELVRIRVVSQRTKAGVAAVVGSTLLDHIVNGVTLAPLAVLIAASPSTPAWMRRGVLIVLCVVLAVGTVAWFAAPSEGARTPHGVGPRAMIARARAGLTALRSPGAFFRAISIGLLAWTLELATTVLTTMACGLGSGLTQAAVVLVAVNLALVVPSPPANLGTFEVGAVLALTALGVPTESAVAFALCYHFMQLASVWIAGIVTWLLLRRGGARGEPVTVGG